MVYVYKSDMLFIKSATTIAIAIILSAKLAKQHKNATEKVRLPGRLVSQSVIQLDALTCE